MPLFKTYIKSHEENFTLLKYLRNHKCRLYDEKPKIGREFYGNRGNKLIHRRSGEEEQINTN